MNVNINLAFLSLSILYVLLLNVVFIKKGHIKTFELDTFGRMITLNLIGILLEFGCIFSIKYLNNDVLIMLINKMFLLYLVTFAFLFSLYVFSISFPKTNKNNNSFKLIIASLYFISVFLIFYLKLYIHNQNDIIYSYGPSTNVVYVASTICIILCFVSMIKNYKELKSKKYLPLFIYIMGGSLVAIIQKVNPALTLASSMEAYLLMIMYFTIENPDMKLLEEVHKAKVISDNANEEKTMFLYNITNEIRGITKDINLEADNILNETDNKKVDLNIVNDSAREIKGSTAKFTTMTNEILDISQVDASNIKIYNEKYSIKLILKELITKYNVICKNKSLDLRFNIASDIPETLYGDSVGIKNVLITLLDNSIKYTKKGYVELNVNVIKKQDIARLIITIEDSGIGIKSNELNNIINKNKEEIKRNNLKNNLYTAKKLITLMGGTLIISSTYGQGTTMKVVLDQKQEVLDNKYDKVYNEKKILLIEDSETTYKLITKMLKNTKVIIDRVELGSIGLDKIRNKEKYDLIFIEEDLKPLNAYDIIKKLKQIKNFNTKVILLTKNKNIEYSYLYKDYGFSDYLIKPIDKSLLLNIINKY